MQKQVVEAHADRDLRVMVVWLPMVDTDSHEAAIKSSTMFADERVSQFYDPDRVVGLDYSKGVFANCMAEALTVLPKDDELRPMMEEWSRMEPGARALWDAVLLFPPGIEWASTAPAPTRWAKQVMYFGDDPKVSGTFFRDDCKQIPVDSDWHVIVREMLGGFVGAATRPAPKRFELLSFPGCPHTAPLRENARAALAELGLKVEVVDVNLESLPPPDEPRGFGSPTLLVDGKDLLGLLPTSSRSLSCRIYPKGEVPTVSEIVALLRR